MYYFDTMRSLNLPEGSDKTTEMQQFELVGLNVLSGCLFFSCTPFER
jgi:hypothetical protein